MSLNEVTHCLPLKFVFGIIEFRETKVINCIIIQGKCLLNGDELIIYVLFDFCNAHKSFQLNES